jgi:hypothetical protein
LLQLAFVIDPDVLPALLAAGTAVTSSLGVYFDRLRKRKEQEEPARVEQAANEAVSQVTEQPSVPVPSLHGHSDAIVGSAEEIKVAVADAVRKELAAAQKRSARGVLVSNSLFFVAGVMATIAITLFVHPVN